MFYAPARQWSGALFLPENFPFTCPPDPAKVPGRSGANLHLCKTLKLFPHKPTAKPSKTVFWWTFPAWECQ
ncbi:MAG: hypothetical protein AAB316_07105 [Bacteroidota bacterium]